MEMLHAERRHVQKGRCENDIGPPADGELSLVAAMEWSKLLTDRRVCETVAITRRSKASSSWGKMHHRAYHVDLQLSESVLAFVGINLSQKAVRE